jgi:hypothetical protein
MNAFAIVVALGMALLGSAHLLDRLPGSAALASQGDVDDLCKGISENDASSVVSSYFKWANY